MDAPDLLTEKKQSLRALETTNFFLADVQTGLGPFLAASLAGAGWQPGRVGVALTFGGIVTVLLQTPAGAIVDRVPAKRVILVLGALVLAIGATLLWLSAAPSAVYTAEFLIGGSGPFLAPTLAAVTMGLVGVRLFDRQFGKNQSFNAAGNVASALLIAIVSRVFGGRAMFLTAAILTVPTILSVLAIRKGDIDFNLARGLGGDHKKEEGKAKSLITALRGDRVLFLFLTSAFLFHLSNAAMLPQLGEMLTRGVGKTAAPFMSACVIVTQVVIMSSALFVGRIANQHGRKPLLLLGFGVLPLRALLYTLIHNTAGLIAVQVLDGVANTIFGVVSVLVVADRTRGTGHFNLVQGMLATAVGLGAALSTTLGGSLIQHGGYRTSFLTLGAVAVAAFSLLLFGVPETGLIDNASDGTTSLLTSSEASS